METSTSKSPSTMLWIAGTAVTLFCAAGIAAIMGWIPTSSAGANGNPASTTASSANSPSKTYAAPVHTASNAPIHKVCGDCGIVESTREISEPGKGTGVGGVGGAVVGGVLGHQIGNGRGNDLATVAGAVGGAFAGNAIEKRVNSTKSYEVTVRMEGGSSRVFSEASSNWHNGDHVRIVDGAIRAN